MSGQGAIQTKTFQVAISMVRLCQDMVNKEREFLMSKQLLRSGTAVGALIREAQNAEIKADFIHKLAIAQKECDESIYWLDLLLETNYLAQTQKINLLMKLVSF